MDTIEKLIQRVQKTEHGFLDIQKAAAEVVEGQSAEEGFRIAKQLFTSELYQVRSLATFILGGIAANSKEALEFLKRHVSQDKDWRVQEILAKAFDGYCADLGYEQALFVIKEWLADSSPNVRRAVTEGLRIWTGRPYFKDHPEVAIQLLSQFRDDDSEYVRKSIMDPQGWTRTQACQPDVVKGTEVGRTHEEPLLQRIQVQGRHCGDKGRETAF